MDVDFPHIGISLLFSKRHLPWLRKGGLFTVFLEYMDGEWAGDPGSCPILTPITGESPCLSLPKYRDGLILRIELFSPGQNSPTPTNHLVLEVGKVRTWQLQLEAPTFLSLVDSGNPWVCFYLFDCCLLGWLGLRLSTLVFCQSDQLCSGSPTSVDIRITWRAC